MTEAQASGSSGARRLFSPSPLLILPPVLGQYAPFGSPVRAKPKELTPKSTDNNPTVDRSKLVVHRFKFTVDRFDKNLPKKYIKTQGVTMPKSSDWLPNRRDGILAMADKLIFGDCGKTVFFVVAIANDGKKGPWGPMASALIP
jgi:hypothetical protein